MLVICNFAAIPYEGYQVGVPFAGKYKEIFNSDAAEFGGDGVVNARAKTAKEEECDERAYSIKVKLPALGVSIYSCTPVEAPKKKIGKAVSGVKERAVKKAGKAEKTKTTKETKVAKERKATEETKATKATKAIKATRAGRTTKKSVKRTEKTEMLDALVTEADAKAKS